MAWLVMVFQFGSTVCACGLVKSQISRFGCVAMWGKLVAKHRAHPHESTVFARAPMVKAHTARSDRLD